MAISPRAGIINLDFKDVYQMAKDINENDPLRQAIRVGGQLISDRDRKIMYDRLLSGDETAGGKTSAEALGNAWDWLKQKGGDVANKIYDVATTVVPTEMQFASPFDQNTSDADVANQVMEEVRNEEGKKSNLPLPTDIYEGEPNTPVTEGTKTTFPTTTVRQQMKSPQATIQEQAPVTAEKPQEVTSPVASTEAPSKQLKAPRDRSEAERWSEMYRLNPERAMFDWNRIAPKGSGASSVVQARLEHDAEIDKQIAGLSTQLRKDMLANGWTSTSPEFLERYGEIQELEASKYVKGDKNQFEKSVRLTDKEIDQKISADKFNFDKEKEVSRVDEKAFDVTNKAMGDLMGEKYSMPAKYGHIASSLASAVADPNNINEGSIKTAVKAFIQSIDDSVVMAHEAMTFADQSTIGRIRATLQGLYDDNIYSPDRLGEIWDNMDAYMETYKQGIGNIAEYGKAFYTTYGGKNPAVFDSWVDLMTADANLPPKPDFSVVGPWWESQQTKTNKKGTGLKAPVYGGGGNNNNNDDDDVGGIS